MLERLKFITSEIWDFLKPLIIFLLTRAGRALMKAARFAVETIQQTHPEASGPEKAKLALDLIRNMLMQQGYEIATELINAAIEAAVVELRRRTA